MSSGARRRTFLRIPFTVWILWILAALAIPVWLAHDSSAWDLRVYGKALDSLQAGRDPYTDATDIQKRHHQERLLQGSTGVDDAPPYSYVYAPLTLPFLRTAGHLPRTALTLLYWAIYIAGTLAAVAVGVTLAAPEEFVAALYMAGLAPFFPGLLANGTVLGGNVAYLIYGGVLTMALVGWRRGWWTGFYLAVLLAACIKAPLLSLVLIAPLSAPRQWFKAALTTAAGLTLFLAQPIVAPVLFRHYLEAVELQFSFNRDFGSGPAGLFSSMLAQRGLSYAPTSYFFYAGCAALVFGALVVLSRKFLRGDFPLTQWAPVLLTGIILLNPRIMEYDTAAITLPLALILWRMVQPARRGWAVSVATAATLFAMNAGALYSWELRKALNGPLMVFLFAAGCVQLLKTSRTSVEAAAASKQLEAPARAF